MKKTSYNQPKLLENEIPDNVKKASDDFHWRQFCKLGEMMGEGLHYEADGKWIAAEYKKLSRILIPEIRDVEKARRLRKTEAINESMKKLLLEKKCDCGGILVQSRSGSKVCYCYKCDQRYKVGKKPKS